MTTPLIIGSRGSDLALWQSRWVAAHLGIPTEIKIIQTQGDRILDRDLTGVEGKGFFTKELEDALYARSIDIAVHSLKDLPTTTPPGLHIAAVCERAPASDILLVHPDWHDPDAPLPIRRGGRVGASSLRRQAFVRGAGQALEPVSLRGNVPTRVRKCKEGQYAAVVLAEAGLSRLAIDFSPLRAYRLSVAQWLPAPGQGALGIETRSADPAGEVCARLNHGSNAERLLHRARAARSIRGRLPSAARHLCHHDARRIQASGDVRSGTGPTGPLRRDRRGRRGNGRRRL